MIISSYLDSFSFTNIILTSMSKDMNSSPIFPEGLKNRRESDPKGSENGVYGIPGIPQNGH